MEQSFKAQWPTPGPRRLGLVFNFDDNFGRPNPFGLTDATSTGPELSISRFGAAYAVEGAPDDLTVTAESVATLEDGTVTGESRSS